MYKLLKLRRMLAAMLVLALSLAMSPVAYARETGYFEPLEVVAGNYDMADFGDVEPSAALFDEYRTRVLTCNAIKNRAELVKALISFNDEYQQLHAAESLAMYQYYCDPLGYADDYRLWQELITRVDRDYQETWRVLANSDNHEMIEELVAPELLARYAGTTQVSDELLAKRQAVQGLTADYWQAIDADYRVTYGGKSYGFADLAGIDDADTYNAVYKLLAKERNAAVGGLLADVIPTANAYARELGYANYADYAYSAVYARDYTPEKAQQLHALVKKYIVPLYTELLAAEANPRFDWDALSAAGDMTGEEMLAKLRLYLPEISDELAAAFDYMQAHNLANVEPDEDKLTASFTSYISYLRIALLFIGSHSGTAHDICTLAHEFGHFAYYMYEQRDTGFDVGEFHSQGLEMLFLHFADDIFGAGGAAHRLNELTQQVRAVVDGCLYDEFQQLAYQLEKPTVAELNRLFHDLAVQYGYVYIHDDDEAYNWVTTAHTFIQPFYYMSYAVSGLSALELLGRSADDFEGACDDYLSMATLRENDYQKFVKKAGLADIFSESGIQKITAGLRAYLYDELLGLGAADELDGHWAADSLLAALRVGLLAGDENGKLRPDDAVTRAEALVLLWRANGEPAGSGRFADVPEGAWYAGAAGWAADSGISRGSDGGNFCGADTLTREELVVLLYRLAGADGGDVAVLDGYTDAAEISPWAREAFAWAVADGVVSGVGGGSLAPKAAATRAQVVVLALQ